MRQRCSRHLVYDEDCVDCQDASRRLEANNYRKLLDEILEHRYRYYVLATPTISDYDYDKLERRLLDMEEAGQTPDPHSPSQVPGGDAADGYPQHIQDIFKKEAFAALTCDVEKLQRKCQKGFPRHMIDESNNLHAACYGMLGRLLHELGKALKIE